MNSKNSESLLLENMDVNHKINWVSIDIEERSLEDM